MLTEHLLFDWIYNIIGGNFKRQGETGRGEVIWGDGCLVVIIQQLCLTHSVT